MADNPWHKYSSSPWVLMIGSGEIGDFWENYEGFGRKRFRSMDYSYRPFAVAFLKLTLDHVLKMRPRLISDPKVVRGKYDFYFGSRTENRDGRRHRRQADDERHLGYWPKRLICS